MKGLQAKASQISFGEARSRSTRIPEDAQKSTNTLTHVAVVLFVEIGTLFSINAFTSSLDLSPNLGFFATGSVGL